MQWTRRRSGGARSVTKEDELCLEGVFTAGRGDVAAGGRGWWRRASTKRGLEGGALLIGAVWLYNSRPALPPRRYASRLTQSSSTRSGFGVSLLSAPAVSGRAADGPPLPAVAGGAGRPSIPQEAAGRARRCAGTHGGC